MTRLNIDNIFKGAYNHRTYAGIVQLVERFLAKEEVYGFDPRCPLSMQSLWLLFYLIFSFNFIDSCFSGQIIFLFLSHSS